MERDMKNDSFWSEMGQDLKNRGHTPHKEIPGVSPRAQTSLWELNRFFCPNKFAPLLST